jgi:peptidoglycan/xylan/chitin deacetylase (PgdA/CDA1 family)
MNDRQLQEMLRNGMEPACHGLYHIPLDTKNNDMVNQEVLSAKRQLSHLFKEPFDIKHYILPHGKFNDKTLSTIRQAGYDSCLATKNRTIQENADLYQLPRIHGHKKKRNVMWTLTQ